MELLTRRQWVLSSIAGALAASCNVCARLGADSTSRPRRIRVHGLNMAWRERGAGPVLVFLHGNPTSSHLWRHCLAVLGAQGSCCLAPDLIGMGSSDKLQPSGACRYSLQVHITFLDSWFQAVVDSTPHIFIGHDWGGVLADNHLLEQVFLEQFPNMASTDRAAYRAPFALSGESRRATISWPRNVPLDGLPPASAEIVGRALDCMAQSAIPRMSVNAEPGGLIVGRRRDLVRRWPSLAEVTVSSAHYVPEHVGPELPTLILPWLGATARTHLPMKLEDPT
jgi:haloalkane dehalogenase